MQNVSSCQPPSHTSITQSLPGRVSPGSKRRRRPMPCHYALHLRKKRQRSEPVDPTQHYPRACGGCRRRKCPPLFEWRGAVGLPVCHQSGCARCDQPTRGLHLPGVLQAGARAAPTREKSQSRTKSPDLHRFRFGRNKSFTHFILMQALVWPTATPPAGSSSTARTNLRRHRRSHGGVGWQDSTQTCSSGSSLPRLPFPEC
jgi:hypothetical protein